MIAAAGERRAAAVVVSGAVGASRVWSPRLPAPVAEPLAMPVARLVDRQSRGTVVTPTAQGRGLSALDAGLVFTSMAIAYVAASARAPALVIRFGRRLLAIGALVLAAGHGLLLAAVAHIGVGGSIAQLVPGLVLIGTGMGLLLVPLTTTILSSVDPRHAGGASGAVTTVQNVGGALGVTITGVIFFGALHGGYAHALELSLAELGALLLGVAALTRLLPATPGS